MKDSTRTDHSRNKCRDWADISDYPDREELLEFGDLSDMEIQPSNTRVAEVTAATQTLLDDKCLTKAENNDRLKTRNV